MIRLLGLNTDETNFALRSFAAKVVLFWLVELLICNLDHKRAICAVVGRGFLPCLLSFAVMDWLIIPRMRRRLTSLRPNGRTIFSGRFLSTRKPRLRLPKVCLLKQD